MFIEDLVADIGVWEAYFRMRRLYLRTPIPESTDKDRGIVSGRHHRAMKVADRQDFAGAPGLAASEFRLEQPKARPGPFRLASDGVNKHIDGINSTRGAERKSHR